MCSLEMRKVGWMGRPKGMKMSQAAKDKIALAVRNRWIVQKERQKKELEEALAKLDKEKGLVQPIQVTNTIKMGECVKTNECD